jgi:hypothetical protein
MRWTFLALVCALAVVGCGNSDSTPKDDDALKAQQNKSQETANEGEKALQKDNQKKK